LPPDATAIVSSGAYGDLVSCDGVKLSSTQLKVAVLPGEHTIRITMRRQTIGFKVLYSGEVGSVTFVAEAGHRYLADVELIPQGKWLSLATAEYDWIGHIVDRETGRIIGVTTEPLPVRLQWINSPIGLGTFPN
jgi:hypothetical protein